MNKKYTERTHVIKMANFDCCAVMIVGKSNGTVRLHTINYKTNTLVRVCNDVNSEISGLICKSYKGLMLRWRAEE